MYRVRLDETVVYNYIIVDYADLSNLHHFCRPTSLCQTCKDSSHGSAKFVWDSLASSPKYIHCVQVPNANGQRGNCLANLHVCT